MPKLLKGRERTSQIISAGKVIIAPEGVSTEVDYFNGIQEYFEGLKEKVSKRYEQLIDVVVVKRGEIEKTEEDKAFAVGSSSPTFVANYVKKYLKCREIDLETIDQVFVLVDKDNWEDKNLAKAQQECKNNDFNFIVSSPSFEVWLLLHYVDIFSLDDELKNLIRSNKTPPGKPSYLKIKLKEVIPGFNYNNLNIENFDNNIHQAIKNSNKLKFPDVGWSDDIGTQIPKVFIDTKLFSQLVSSTEID
ncbi:RloB family protein [Vibrio sp. RC27]